MLVSGVGPGIKRLPPPLPISHKLGGVAKKLKNGKQKINFTEWEKIFEIKYMIRGASQVVLVVKNPPTTAGDIRDTGLIPSLGRSPGGGRSNPL